MNYFIFESYGNYHVVDEKTAHNYLRNPSGAQKAALTYLGAIPASLYDLMIKTVVKEKKEKFGGIGQGEENDDLIIESRLYTDARIAEETQKLVDVADKKILPRKYDYLVGNIASADSSFNQPADNLADAIKKLQRR
jgi:hypothetical protein